MGLTNIEISILSQCTLGLAYTCGLIYKTNHYKDIWKLKYNLKNYEIKSSILLSSCKLIWGALICHIFNLFTADVNCPLLLDNSLTYYPMYTLVTGFELGYIFIEPILVKLLKNIGTMYNISGLKYPDVYPNLREVYDIKDIKNTIYLFFLFLSISFTLFFLNDYNKNYLPIFIPILIIGSILISIVVSIPFYLETNRLGMRKINSDNQNTTISIQELRNDSSISNLYVNKKDLYINIGSWVTIKILMKTIWLLYIFNSGIKNDLCSIAQNAVFHNKFKNALFYMVFCSLIINIISVCYQYVFMNGDNIKTIKYNFYSNKKIKKCIKIITNIILISLFSSIIWIFYIIEILKDKKLNVNYQNLALSTTLFPSGIYLLFIILKKIILYSINYKRFKICTLVDEYNEL